LTPGEPFKVLAVCHGNISRSPAAEYLLRAALDGRFAVASAGVGAHQVAGSGPDRFTLAMLGKRGIDGSRHVSKQLTAGLIGQAELILTMSPNQRSWVTGEVPGAIGRSFTLLEFARLAVAVRGQGPESVSDMVRRAAASRGVYPVAPGGSDEIADPHGGALEDYRAAFEAVDRAVAVAAGELNGYLRLRTPAPAHPFAGFVL
jgi:protein-tyrosine phosphatase